ncbi:MAG: tyrosine-type recombinase/integrase [Ruminococcus sp.]
MYGQKGKKERKVYLTEGCVYHLKKYLESRDDNNPALFVRGRKPYNRLGRQAIQDMLRKLGAEAGVHAHPHKFRRTLLTDAGARGVPLQEIQAYAGHAKSDTTMLYVSVKQESVKASLYASDRIVKGENKCRKSQLKRVARGSAVCWKTIVFLREKELAYNMATQKQRFPQYKPNTDIFT